jgi:Na+-transporting NADH:ubiquinone oxidoreductase subunit C
MPGRESVARTLLVAGGVALFCSLLVSSAVYWLRPIQRAYETIDRNRAILVAAGLIAADATLTDGEIVRQFLRFDVQLVDLDRGEVAAEDDVAARQYDYASAASDLARSRETAAGKDAIGLGRRPLLMPVYVLRDGPIVERIVFPVFGRGMWSTIHAYVGLEGDFFTVAGVDFFDHGETPGIGDRIENPNWTASWRGKRLLDQRGDRLLRIGGSDNGSRGEESVDAITGATVTVTAVDRIVGYWFGADGYGPFLSTLRATD